MANAQDDDDLETIDGRALMREVSGGAAARPSAPKPTAPTHAAPSAHWSLGAVAHAAAGHLVSAAHAVHSAVAPLVPAHASPAHAPPAHAAPAHAAPQVAPTHATPIAHSSQTARAVATASHPRVAASPAAAIAQAAHSLAHTAHSVGAAARVAAGAIGSVVHQVAQHAGQLIPPIHAAPHGAPSFTSGAVYRVSSNGHAAPVQSVPSNAVVYVNGLHPFHNGTGDAIHGAQAVSHNNGNRDVYVVYNGHSTPWSLLQQRDPAHPDAATARVTQIMQQNHGKDTFVGYSQGGAEIVNAAQRYAASGGTDGHHGLAGVKISAWGSTAASAGVNRVAGQGAQIVDYVHPTVEHRVAGIAVPSQIGDFWARVGGGAHVTIVDGKTVASDAHTVAIAPHGDDVFHVYDAASDPQLGDKRNR